MIVWCHEQHGLLQALKPCSCLSLSLSTLHCLRPASLASHRWNRWFSGNLHASACFSLHHERDCQVSIAPSCNRLLRKPSVENCQRCKFKSPRILVLDQKWETVPVVSGCILTLLSLSIPFHHLFIHFQFSSLYRHFYPHFYHHLLSSSLYGFV